MAENLTLRELGEHTIRLASDNVKKGGGPFGAIIVKNGAIISTGVNSVTSLNDPTAHAEVIAIRNACEVLGDYQLNDCILITSCEPCPMCLGATYWARVKAVYYIADKKDAALAGFDDSFIYDELDRPHMQRNIPFIKMDSSDYNVPFEVWALHGDKRLY
jgi:guanine deaminase